MWGILEKLFLRLKYLQTRSVPLFMGPVQPTGPAGLDLVLLIFNYVLYLLAGNIRRQVIGLKINNKHVQVTRLNRLIVKLLYLAKLTSN